MNINSIRNSITSNFKPKPKNSINKDAGVKNSADFFAKNTNSKDEKQEIATSVINFFETDSQYLPKGSENNNWGENSDLDSYFSASKYPINKGVYVDTYA